MNSLMLRGLTAAALIAALCVANAASAQEGNSPLSAIGRMFGQKPAQQTAGQDEAEGPTTEQVLRIERLEAQIRQMTGTDRAVAVPQPAARKSASRRWRRRSRRPAAAPTGRSRSRQPDGPAAGPGRSRLPATPPPPPPATDAAPTCSIRRRIPMRRACRVRSAACQNEPPPIVTAEPPVGAPGGRRAGAPLDLSTLSGVPGAEPGVLAGGRPVAAAAVAQSQRHRRGGRGRAAVGFAEGHLRSRLRLCAAQGLRAGGRHLPRLPEEISDRPPRRRRGILAGREPVPAPAL